MELNLQAQKELKRLKVLSAQLKDEENRWVELHMNKQEAKKRGEALNVLNKYDDQIIDAARQITNLKSMIIERVHLLTALMDAQIRTDGGAAAVHAKL